MCSIEKGMVDWEAVFADADWFHWTGITPALSQGAADACLEAIQVANRMGVTVSTDLNYRKKLWTQISESPKSRVRKFASGDANSANKSRWSRFAMCRNRKIPNFQIHSQIFTNRF